MALPRVSVVLPAFNAAATLPAALESLQQQDFRDWELLAVDDGSTDDTGKILTDAARADSRIQPVTLPHQGIVPALQRGLDVARGEFIARFDADDMCLAGRLGEQVLFLEAHPEIGVASCLVEFGGSSITRGGYAAHVDWLNSVVTPAEIEQARFIDAPLAHPSVMFRRTLVERHGGYRDGEFPEDYELWLRWLEAGVKMAKVPQTLLRWNDPPHRLSRSDARYGPPAFFRLKAGYLARWLRRHLAPDLPVLVWGAGRLTRRRVDPLLADGIAVAAYIDIDPRKLGTRPDGRRVIPPDALPEPGSAFVIGFVANRGARDLQRSFLTGHGWSEGRDFLFAA